MKFYTRVALFFIVAIGAPFTVAGLLPVAAQNPGFQILGAATSGHCVSLVNKFQGQDTGQPCVVGAASALTKTDDTNVTLTLGGTPATALLKATSLTLGWTGQLSPTRAGATPAIHSALLDVAGVSTWTVIPDCQDTSGKHLNYTQSTDAYSCGTGLGNAITALAGGDVTASGPGSVAATLATVLTAGGPTGSATVAPIITWDLKGRVTAISSATIAPPFSALTGQATLAQLPSMNADTLLANFTAGAAVPTAFNVPACAADGGHALTYTNATGLLCTAIPAGGTVTSVVCGSSTITTTGTCTPPYFSAYLNSAQTVSSGVATKILFDTKTGSAAGQYDAVTNFRFTPTLAGTYLINVQMFSSGTTRTGANVYIYKNGSVYGQSNSDSAAASGSQPITMQIAFNGSTDYIEGWGAVTAVSGAAFLNGTAPQFTFISANFIGP